MSPEPAVAALPYAPVLEAFLRNAAATPDKAALIRDDGAGATEARSYREAAEEVLSRAALLRSMGFSGRPVALLFGPGLEVVIAVLSCFAAGALAVPVAPVGRRRHRLANLVKLLDDCAPAALVFDERTERQYGGELGSLAAQCGAAAHRWDSLVNPSGTGPPARSEANDVAVIQYTSGSTGKPKGVMITHGNISANQQMIREAFELDERSTFVGWAPHYHDQGLFGNILQPLFNGATCVLAAPAAFIKRPLTWVELVSRHHAHVSGGPDFAYALCTEHAKRRGVADLDLASWRVAFNGAEPIRRDTMSDFARAFEPFGFRRSAFLPCYGLAECTLLATGRRITDAPILSVPDRGNDGDGPRSSGVVCCGPPVEGCDLRIMDPSGTEVPQGREGEVWLAGPHVAAGYWGNGAATSEAFGAVTAAGEGPFLRTGDLGFLTQDGLYVCGRAKDLLIVRGRNFYPSDLEQLWNALEMGSGLRCAAVQVDRPGRTHVVLVSETERRPEGGMEPAEWARASLETLQREALARLDLAVSDLVLVPIGAVPSTTSGKVRRSEVRRMVVDRSTTFAAVAGPLAAAEKVNAESSDGHAFKRSGAA